MKQFSQKRSVLPVQFSLFTQTAYFILKNDQILGGYCMERGVHMSSGILGLVAKRGIAKFLF